MKLEFADCPGIEYSLPTEERLRPVAERVSREPIFRGRPSWYPGGSREAQSTLAC